MIASKYSTNYAGNIQGYTNETILYVAAVESDGSSLTANQKSILDTLIIDLKNAGIWTKMKAIYPFIGGTSSLHKWNLKDPRDSDAAFRLVFFGGWTHNSLGISPNGTTGYANTFFDSTMFTTNSTHITFYSLTDSAAADQLEIGERDAVCEFGLQLKNTGGNCYSMSGSNVNYSPYSNPNSKGFYTSNRVNSTSQEGWKNGVIASSGNNAFATSTLPFFISADNDYGVATRFSNKTCSFASIGDGLTSTESLAEYTAIQKYQTSLSRNV